QADRQLDRQQTKKRGELNHWIQGDRRSVLERIAHRIANYGGIVQRGAFLFQINLDNLLRIVPGAAGVGHEDSLIKTEDGDRNQIADKEERLEKSESERREENGQEDIEHTFLRILGADFHDLLTVLDRSLFHAFQLDV